MEYLDIFKTTEELQTKKNRFKRLIKNDSSKIFLYLSTLVSQSALIAVNPNAAPFIFTNTLSSLLIAYSIYNLNNCWKNTNSFENELLEQIRNTSTYQECLFEYHEYIKDLADFINMFGFSTIKEIVIYLQFLLENGLLSEKLSHQYYSYKYETDILSELYGTRVLEGKSVCRHVSSLFVDTINELNYTSCNVVTSVIENLPAKTLKSKEIDWNHSIIGVEEKGELLLYDAIGKCFVNSFDGTKNNLIESYRIGKSCVPISKPYYLIDYYQKTLNYNRSEENLNIIYKPIMTVSSEEQEYLIDRVKDFYILNMVEAFEFYQKEQNRMVNIVKLAKSLSPHTDKEISSWLVKK